ncbi:MAG: hypothetical protein LBQ88_20975 [Treponema sp.]|nr:hypothetical protein [Treponema sp.]
MTRYQPNSSCSPARGLKDNPAGVSEGTAQKIRLKPRGANRQYPNSRRHFQKTNPAVRPLLLYVTVLIYAASEVTIFTPNRVMVRVFGASMTIPRHIALNLTHNSMIDYLSLGRI